MKSMVERMFGDWKKKEISKEIDSIYFANREVNKHLYPWEKLPKVIELEGLTSTNILFINTQFK